MGARLSKLVRQHARVAAQGPSGAEAQPGPTLPPADVCPIAYEARWCQPQPRAPSRLWDTDRKSSAHESAIKKYSIAGMLKEGEDAESARPGWHTGSARLIDSVKDRFGGTVIPTMLPLVTRVRLWLARLLDQLLLRGFWN